LRWIAYSDKRSPRTSGLKTAAVLLSVCATAVRNGFEPWRYLTITLDALARNPADLMPLLPIRN